MSKPTETQRTGAQIEGMPQAFDAILALGTNIGDRLVNMETALERLTAGASVHIIERSRLYRTAPWGVTDQDWFVNACVGVETELSPHELLRQCQAVESDMGRIRMRHWGPRVIDVDILAIRDVQINAPDLVVPHPFIAERAFVLIPLRDIAPKLTIGGKSIDVLLEALDTRDVMPLES